MASGLFRVLAALGREMVVADTFGSFAQLILLILGGYLIARGTLNLHSAIFVSIIKTIVLSSLSADNIKAWWIWGYWCSPLMYAQNAIAVNEFLGHTWRKVMQCLLSSRPL
jgi:hypothetical protein